MRDDLNFKRYNRIQCRFDDFWPVAAVDRGIGKMEKEVERSGLPRAVRQETVEEFCSFWPDAGQVRRRREKRVEKKGPHRYEIGCFLVEAARTRPRLHAASRATLHAAGFVPRTLFATCGSLDHVRRAS